MTPEEMQKRDADRRRVLSNLYSNKRSGIARFSLLTLARIDELDEMQREGLITKTPHGEIYRITTAGEKLHRQVVKKSPRRIVF